MAGGWGGKVLVEGLDDRGEVLAIAWEVVASDLGPRLGGWLLGAFRMPILSAIAATSKPAVSSTTSHLPTPGPVAPIEESGEGSGM